MCLSIYFSYHLLSIISGLFLLLGTSLYIGIYKSSEFRDSIGPPLKRIQAFLQVAPTRKPKPVKLVTYYNRPPWISPHIFDKCVHKCRLISSKNYKKSDVVVFHAPDIHSPAPFRKYPGQIWVFHDMEPPSLVPNFKNWRRLFNWTLSYRRDADLFNPYSFFTRRPHVDSQIGFDDAVWKNKTRNLGWIVSHCGVESQRLKFGNELVKFLDVDIFGRCGKLHCPRGKWKECIEQHKFYASFENSLCVDYVTEKTFRVFERRVNSIPVTRGAPDFSIYLPPGSYVSTNNFSSIKNLGSALKKLSDDNKSYKTYFQWRRYYQADDMIDSRIGFCKLCEKLHRMDDHYDYGRVYENIDEWVRQGAMTRHSCRTVSDIK